MKKVLMVVLAVLMILPLAVSCGGGREGNPVTVSNVLVTNHSDPAAPATLFGADGETLTAYVEEGKELTVRDIVDAYCDDIAGGYYDEDAHAYTKLGDYAESAEFFWNYYVNNAEAGLGTKVPEGAKVEIRYEKK